MAHIQTVGSDAGFVFGIDHAIRGGDVASYDVQTVLGHHDVTGTADVTTLKADVFCHHPLWLIAVKCLGLGIVYALTMTVHIQIGLGLQQTIVVVEQTTVDA